MNVPQRTFNLGPSPNITVPSGSDAAPHNSSLGGVVDSDLVGDSTTGIMAVVTGVPTISLVDPNTLLCLTTTTTSDGQYLNQLLPVVTTADEGGQGNDEPVVNTGSLNISNVHIDQGGEDRHLFDIDIATVDSTTTTSTGAAGYTDKKLLPTTKRKGGWPKGKKRKLEATDNNAPKAPYSAYVQYMNEERVKMKEKYPNMTFPDMTRILGTHWSAMPPDEKKKYFDQADLDRKRYMEELKIYQQTTESKCEQDKKVSNPDDDSSGFVPEIDPSLFLQDIDDHDCNYLYCKTCNQYFNSLHNKQEHLLGSKHLSNLINKYKKPAVMKPVLSDVLPVSGGTRTGGGEGTIVLSTSEPFNPNDITDYTLHIIYLHNKREEELKFLRTTNQHLKTQNDNLQNKLQQLKKVPQHVETDIGEMKVYGTSLLSQLESLCAVPNLFGIALYDILKILQATDNIANVILKFNSCSGVDVNTSQQYV